MVIQIAYKLQIILCYLILVCKIARNPLWALTPRIVQKVTLGADIVCPIAGRGILANFVLIGHSQCGPRQRTRGGRGEWRRMVAEPGDVGLTGVGAAAGGVSVVVLRYEGVGKITEPAIVRR